MARTGIWSIPSIIYGAPPSVLKPSDNVVEATPSQQESDALAQQIASLEQDISNAIKRDPNAGNARLP